jgi:hypothetical protein
MPENNEITTITKITLPVVGKFAALAKFTRESCDQVLCGLSPPDDLPFALPNAIFRGPDNGPV